MAVEVVPIGGTVTVCQDGSCDYGTIQAGVNNADPYDTVLVKPGVYNEQVDVSKPLELVGEDGAVIDAPEALEGDDDGRSNLLTITGETTKVRVTGFTLRGPVKGLDAGVQVKDDAFAVVEGNEIRAIRDDPLSGAQRGVGVMVGPLWSESGTPGKAQIRDNVIRDFQKSAVTVTGEESEAFIDENDIDCSGRAADDTVAQDAIQVWQSASADIVDNSLEDCYSVLHDTPRGVGVHLSNGVHDTDIVNNTFEGTQTAVALMNFAGFAAGEPAQAENLEIAENTIEAGADGDGGIYLAGSADGVTVTDNTITGHDSLGVFVGPDSWIDAPDSQDVEIDDNELVANDAPAIHVRSSAGNVSAHFNQIQGNDVGVLNEDDEAVDAAHNWWGSPAGPTLTDETSPITGDSVEGPVAFAPFCVDADCDANRAAHGTPAPHVAAPPTAVPPSAP